jgi:hypothetical protein
MPPGLPPDVLDHRFRSGVHGRFFQGGLGLQLWSFGTATTPQPSLTYNLKYVPKALTGNSVLYRGFPGYPALSTPITFSV